MNYKIFWNKNGSLICSALAVSGIVASNILTADATKKAMTENNANLTKKQLFKKHYKKYIAPSIVAIATIASITGVKIIDAKKQAELTASLLAVKASYKNFQNTVEKVVGKDTIDEIKSVFNKEKLEEDNVSFRIPAKPIDDPRQLYWIGYGYNDYFWSTPSEIERAEGTMNKIFRKSKMACPNDFLDALGLNGTEEGFINGWGELEYNDVLMDGWINIDETVTKHDDGLEVHVLEFCPFPVSDYEDDTRTLSGDRSGYLSLGDSYNDERYRQERQCDIAIDKYEQKYKIFN